MEDFHPGFFPLSSITLPIKKTGPTAAVGLLFAPGCVIGVVLCEEQVNNKYHYQDRGQHDADDDHCGAAYMHLVIKFSDQETVGQKAQGENYSHDELDPFKHIPTSR
jgi:hypothetical protein